jgi:hypothetical protein
MFDDPGILREARELVALYRTTEGVAPPVEELARARTRLRSFAAHPSCGEALRERTLGILLVVDVLVSGAPAPQRVGV